MNFFARFAHWFNTFFTLGTISFDFDLFLKIAAFAFVTIPLGVVQWLNAAEKWEARRRKRNGITKT